MRLKVNNLLETIKLEDRQCYPFMSFDLIFIIVNQVTKMVHSKQAQIIDTPKLVGTISDIF